MRTTDSRTRRRMIRSAVVACVVAAVVVPISTAASAEEASTASGGANRYHQTNLVSDIPGLATLTDPNLVNPWGLAAGPDTPLWVSDADADVATVYTGAVGGTPPAIAPLVVDIPGGGPTGQVYNPTTGFVVRSGSAYGPARFLFATEAGRIVGWNPDVPPPAPSTLGQTGATVPGANYKGLALARTIFGFGSPHLYAANFHAGTIDVFDSRFRLVHLPGSFRDKQLPDGFAPFGVQAVGRVLVVTYAKQDADKEDEVAGAGLGFVDVYSTDGFLLRRLVRQGRLNAPWGVALAPDGFGAFSGSLLIGNFGDGAINAYNPLTGAFRGTLRDEHGAQIRIEGLWGLRFGNQVFGGPKSLVFSAGIDDESHGLLGTIRAA